MKLKKIFSIGLTSLLIFYSTILTFNDSSTISSKIGIKPVSVDTKSRGIEPMNSIYINNDDYTGFGYSSQFTCAARNGNNLNIYVKNNCSDPLIFRISGFEERTVTINL